MASEVFRSWGASFAEIGTVLRRRVPRPIVVCVAFRLAIALVLLLCSRDLLPSLIFACVTTLVFVDIRELLSLYSAAVLVASGRSTAQYTVGGLSQSIFEVTVHFVLMVGYVFVLLTIAIESLHDLVVADSPRADGEVAVDTWFLPALLLLLHVACQFAMKLFGRDPRLRLPTRRRAQSSDGDRLGKWLPMTLARSIRPSQWLIEDHAAVPLGTLVALVVVAAANIAGPVADVMTTMLLETWQITFVVRHLQQVVWILAGGEASQHCPVVHQFRCVLERELLMIRGVSHVLEWNTHVTASRYDGPTPEVMRVELRVHLRVSQNSQSLASVTREAKALLQRQDQWVDAAFVSTEEGTSGWSLGSSGVVNGGSGGRGTSLSAIPLPILPPPPPAMTALVVTAAAATAGGGAVETASSAGHCGECRGGKDHRHSESDGASQHPLHRPHHQQSGGAHSDRFAIF